MWRRLKPDVAAELAGAQFAVHTASSEGFANAVLEEMVAGLPVVAFAVGALPLLVGHGRSGLLLGRVNHGAHGMAIEMVATRPDLRVRMGAAARARAAEFSWATCVQQHLELFDEFDGHDS